VPPDVQPVREAAAEELGDKSKQRKRETGAEALVTASALHEVSLHPGRVRFKLHRLANVLRGAAIPRACSSLFEVVWRNRHTTNTAHP
jgi:hypothetical protein